MNNKKDLQFIIERYVSGKASAEEIQFIEQYYQYLDKGEDSLSTKTVAEIEILEAENLQAIKSEIESPAIKFNSWGLYFKYSVAAVLLFALGFAVLYTSDQQPLKKADKIINVSKTFDVLPGSDRAILTLADGSKIILDNNANSKIKEEEGLTISKTKAGQLIYQSSSISAKSNLIAYNTVETPRGGQYQIVLPDGTKVWLNAASSLRYPERFTETDRKVTLTGEAYFEVAKDKAHPFKVKSPNGNQDVEVMGTHFNINGYLDDQTIKTTLLEGKIKVSNGKSSKILSPGQQSLLSNQSFLIQQVDPSDETAWKDGLFRFNNASLISILYQLERWYDIKIDYSNIPNKRYNGMVPRKSKLSEVLQMLELTGNIDFTIEEGRKLRVSAK